VLQIDTNRVGNIIRTTKHGMKNWMIFGSLEAGENNALIDTLLANCRAQEMDPEDFLIEECSPVSRPTQPPNAAWPLTLARITATRTQQVTPFHGANFRILPLHRHPQPHRI
jgi:hypothetical protein